MIKGTFQFGSFVTEVIVDGNNLMFFDITSNQITTIEGIKIDKTGAIKEFPELKNDDDWKKKAIEKFKNNFRVINGEEEKMEYIRNELEKFGYTSLFKQRAGFRPKKF